MKAKVTIKLDKRSIVNLIEPIDIFSEIAILTNLLHSVTHQITI